MNDRFKWLGLISVACLVITSDLSAYFDGNWDIQRHFLPKEENHFDWKAYQLPLTWRRQWYTVKNGFQATAGSLSQELFYMKHDIKLQADLHKNFTLLYSQEREEFFNSEPIYQQIEARFGHRYYVSVLGFPVYEKKHENLGMAISYNEPYSMKHIKLTYLNQLATYNAKNRDDDRNQATDDVDRTPMLLKLDTRYRLFQKLDLILDLKQEFEGILLDRSGGLEKTYSGHNHSGTLLWHINDQWIYGLAFQSRAEDRSHKLLNPAGATVLDQQIDHYYMDFFANVRFEEDELTFGYLDSGFKNDISASDASQNYRMRLDSKQIYAKWQSDVNDWMKWFSSLQIGTYDYERTGQGKDNGIKLKAGLGLILYKNEAINFLVLTTWAADSLSDGQWDGGNMQLQLAF
jgi:hypothetical protein